MRFARALPCVALLAAVCAPPSASAQADSASRARAYPEKSIRMIVAFSTGASHVMAVLVAEKLRESLGQPVVPDFRPGAGGIVSAELAAKAPADGYTLLLTSPSIVISPALFPKVAYDPFRDFAPISMLGSVPNVMVVHPSVPARTLQELVKLAKAHPGKLNYASGGFGSGRLGTELFRSLAKIDMQFVPYKGAALALAAQLSGEVELVTSTVPATIPYIQSGRLRGLAVMAPERVPAIRSVPTTAEAGMPEVVALTWYGLFAPANVSQDVIERLNAEIVKLLRAPDARSQLTKVGLDPAAGTPAQFAKFVRAEYEKWSRVIREAKIKPQ